MSPAAGLTPRECVDLFCGAGGTSTGLAQAAKAAGIPINLTAINHWPRAIETHKRNHPWARHICERLEALEPREVVPGGVLHLLVASPECTHHSNARGGRPINDQSRASAWQVLRWVEHLHVENILMENVPEFRNWGPLKEVPCKCEGKPVPRGWTEELETCRVCRGAGSIMQRDKTRKGEIYQSFLQNLRSFGYTVENRVLNSADYGAATSRRRLFIIARRNGPIVWPTQTHSKVNKDGQPSMPGTKPWRGAREILDFSIPSESIFMRKKPLAEKTLRRIAVGARKYWGIDLEPFILDLYGGKDDWPARARSTDEPLGAVTGGGRFGVVEPFVLGQQGGAEPRSIDDPLPTIATAGYIRLAQPLIITTDRPETNRSQAKSTDDPVPTVTGNLRIGVVEPFILPVDGPGGNGANNKAKSIDDPLPTIRASRGGGKVVEPFLIANFGERDGQEPRTRSVDEPLPTVTSRGAGTLIKPVMIEYYGNGQARPITEPVPTLTTRDRIGLAIPLTDGRYLDIRFRMLQPDEELAPAMGFTEYEFVGNKGERTKQIGNAVEVTNARALCESILASPNGFGVSSSDPWSADNAVGAEA